MIPNFFSPNQCDSIMLEFTSFIDNTLKKHKAKVEEFDENHDRLDHFYFNQVSANNYADLSFVIKVVLTLSYSQASTERQFSVNNTVLDNNMKEESIVTRKHIIDHFGSKKLKKLMPYSIEINKDLYSSVKGASARYREHLEQKKSETVTSQKVKENENISNEMLKLKKQCDVIKQTKDIMEKDTGESMRLAESEQDQLYMIKSNALKRKCDENKADLRVLVNQDSDLEKKKRKF